MRCLICTNPKRAEIDALLLQRNGRRSGAVAALAAKLGISRGVLWRHRKKHLGLQVSKAVDEGKLTFEARAKLLGEDANRLQLRSENGDDVGEAVKLLGMRMKALQLEAQLSGRLRGGKGGHDVHGGNVDAALAEAGEAAKDEVPDPAEAEIARREFEEVCGEALQ